MATIIELTNEEIAREVAKFFCKLMSVKTPPSDVTVFFNTTLVPKIDADLAPFVSSILDNHSRIFVETSASEVESCMAVLFTLARRVDEESGSTLTRDFVTAVASDVSRADLRHKILTNAFNFTPQTDPVRLFILKSVLEFSTRTSQFSQLSHSFQHLATWTKLCSASVSQVREIYRAAFEFVSASNLHSDHCLSALTAYLASYEGEPDTSAVADVAAFTALQSIRSTEVFHFDALFDLQAIQALQKTNSAVFDLFSIFAVQRVADLILFDIRCNGFIERVGLDRDWAFEKIRLLTLGSLASQSPQISYQTIAAELQVPVEEVEVWVIKAVNAKLITAKMNQLNQIVTISGCARRHQQVSWKEVEAKVVRWRDNMQQLLTIVQSARVAKDRRM